nr:hypothetical protein [Tanacetum cinerariifolium]
ERWQTRSNAADRSVWPRRLGYSPRCAAVAAVAPLPAPCARARAPPTLRLGAGALPADAQLRHGRPARGPDFRAALLPSPSGAGRWCR